MPVVDEVAGDYTGDVTFLAVAGRGSLEDSTSAAPVLMPYGNMAWAWDEPLWETLEVFGQPVTVMIGADGSIVDTWYGAKQEADIRASLDQLVATAS